MMYLPLMHDFMKLMKMLDRVLIFTFSKMGKKTPHSLIVGTIFGKPGTIEKLKGENLRAKMVSI
jgi:hypothetical protein